MADTTLHGRVDVMIQLEPGHNIFYKISCAPSEDSYQPAQTSQTLRCPDKDDLDPLLPDDCPAKTVL